MGAPTLHGAPAYDFPKVSQELHEIERISTPGGGVGGVPRDTLDMPLTLQLFQFCAVFCKIRQKSRICPHPTPPHTC